MSFDLDALERIVATVPAALVALYSGAGDRGELRIVVRNGRRATNLKTKGNGNIVDLPALEWLARQPRPRIWISDGGVTGIGDRASRSIAARCEQVCAAGRIERCRDVETALDRLRRVGAG